VVHFSRPASYDVIISEPSNPWMAGVSALFTDGFFAEMRSRLRPGGIVCQWFHYYNMSAEHIRLLARTFQQHFPGSAMFVVRGSGPTGDIILIGSNAPLRLRRTPEDPSLPEPVREALAQIENAGTQQIFSGLVVPPSEFSRFAGEGPINTDDRPILEFEAPADRFSADFFGSLGGLLTFSERAHVPTGNEEPPPDRAGQLRSLGFDLPLGPPPGREVERGITVLTRARAGGSDLSRWALIGQAFEDRKARTGLYRLARPVQRPDELEDIAGSLAGSGQEERIPIAVGDHAGIALVAERDGRRSTVVGWTCELTGVARFSTRTESMATSAGPEATAADLAGRYRCAHAAR